MDYDTVYNAFSLTPEHDGWREDFALSEPYQEEVSAWMTCEERVRTRAAEASLDASATDWLVEQTRRFAADPAWVRLVAHLYFIAVVRAPQARPAAEKLPMLPEKDATARDLFYLHVYLSGIARLQEIHRSLAIPPQVTHDTLCDFAIVVDGYRKRTGRWGMDSRMWMQHHFAIELFRLGRLQFQFRTLAWPFRIYRHRETGEITALVQGGEVLREDGQFASADGGEATDGLWTSTLRNPSGEPATIEGEWVDGEKGRVVRQRKRLDLTQWEEALAPGDPVLSIHIPVGGPLSIEACLESFRQAEPFFTSSFPDYSFKAFVCGSWLLDPQLKERLGSETNIARFCRLFFSVPRPQADAQQLFERVFDRLPPSSYCNDALDALPADTSLRRAVIAHLREGKRWRIGGGVILRSKLPAS